MGKKVNNFQKQEKVSRRENRTQNLKSIKKNIEISCYFLVFNKFTKMFEENFQKNSKIYWNFKYEKNFIQFMI